MVARSRYRLESKTVMQKNKGLRIGAVGEATYAALGGDRYWLGVMQMLADFANYSGVGAQTTTGMGAGEKGGVGEGRSEIGDRRSEIGEAR